MFYVFMLLFETFKNRLDRFVLVGRKRLERRELEQIGVLELFNRMNRVVFFAKLCPEVSEPLAILRPLKIIELGIAVVGIRDLVFFVGTEQLNKSILELERCGLVEGGIVDQKGPVEGLVHVCSVLFHTALVVGCLADVCRLVSAVGENVKDGPTLVMMGSRLWRAKVLKRFACLKGLGQGKRVLPKGELITHGGPPFCIRQMMH